MSRLKNRTSQFLIDIGVLMIAFVLAMLVRFDWNVPPVMLLLTAYMVPVGPLRKPMVLRPMPLVFGLVPPSIELPTTQAVSKLVTP